MSQASLLPSASAGKSRERTVVDYERDVEDFYVDPPWCAELLFKEISFNGSVWDPCCGSGNTVKGAISAGKVIYGIYATDLVDRGYGLGGVDFLRCVTPAENIVFNPPYVHAEKFLASQGRRERLFKPHPPATVLILSRRPSMPPGNSGLVAKGGTADYCWLVFGRGHVGPTTMGWLA